jgi:hypothetical protein
MIYKFGIGSAMDTMIIKISSWFLPGLGMYFLFYCLRSTGFNVHGLQPLRCADENFYNKEANMFRKAKCCSCVSCGRNCPVTCKWDFKVIISNSYKQLKYHACQ